MAANKKYRYRMILLFIIYLVLLGYFLFFSEGMGRQRNDAEFRYNLVLFREIKRFIYHADILGMKAVLNALRGLDEETISLKILGTY